MADAAADVTTVRLLCNDPADAGQVFSDAEYRTFLTLEGGVIKLAAAQAIDTIADNEALVSKVIKDRDLETDGAKVADALRKRATTLRNQYAGEVAAQADAEDEGYFGVVDIVGSESDWGPEGTARWAGY